ncbi:MAG: hypothetical protein IJZ02_05300 [Clostridia bacterium]|nr:hypothetical protein [Clostridia bacterium]
MPNQFLAQISRAFFANQRVYRYRMKKIAEMDDDAVIRHCHWYCEENRLMDDFKKFREETEAEHVYCTYLRDYVSSECCYAMQMIKAGYDAQYALSDEKIDRERLAKCCADCEHQL